MENTNNLTSAFTLDEITLPVISQMAESMPGGFFIYHADEKGELICANKALIRLFGCDNIEEFKELTGYTFKGIVHPNDIESVEKSISRQIANDDYAMDYVEYRIIKKDGTVRWVDDYGHFLHTEKFGDVFYVFVEDATERMKRHLDELEKVNSELLAAYAAESQYKRAILHDSILFFEINLTKDKFLVEPTLVKDNKIQSVFESDEIPFFDKYSDFISYRSKNTNQLEPEKYINFFDIKRLIRSYEKGELEQTLETYVTNISGEHHFLQYTVFLGRSDYSGDIIGLATTKDITEQINHQRLLKMALSQANAANIAKNTFLNNMSHDIITPLNSIIGYTELINTHRKDNEKVLEYLNKIRISSKQLLTIVNETLEITRMESGKAVLVEGKCNIIDILNEIEKTIAPIAAAKEITFTINKSNIEHFSIVADVIRIREILCYLLNNSVKYTPEGGDVSLTVEEISDSPKYYGKYSFIVKDNGIGIGKEFIDKMFEPFEREKNTTKSGVLGSGLGLAVTKCIVDMMDGTINVESTPGEGSCFTITLLFLLSEEQMPCQEKDELDPNLLKGKRLLLVEDNEINMEIAKELLTDCGFLVDSAYDGSDAVEIIKNSAPGTYDIVLMDIQMPIMNGYEATRAIRTLANEKLSNIPIIAVSANAFAEDQEKSLEAGMNAHFAKPIDIDNLCKMIGRILKYVK